MELRSCGHLHFIQAIKGGLVTKVLNVTRGRPAISFKEVTDIYECGDLMYNNDDVKAERICVGTMEERTVKTEPDASLCNANDGDDQRIENLDDNRFDNFTLKQIKECFKTRKRKHSQDLDSSKRKSKDEASTSSEDYRKEQMEANDSDFMETLSRWRSKLSNNMKAKKKKCVKDPISTYTQEILPVVKFEEIQNGLEFPPSIEDSTLVEMKFEAPGTDCLDRPDDYSDIVAKEEEEITYEWNLENELNYEWKGRADLFPLRMAWPSSMNIVINNFELTSDQSPKFPAIEFESEECILHPDLHYFSPQVISLVEDHNSDIYGNQPLSDTDTAVSLPNVSTHKGLDCLRLGFRDDSSFLGDCSEDDFTAGAEVQAKPSSSTEKGLSPVGYLVDSSDDPSEYTEKQSFVFVSDDEKRHVNKANDELTSWDEDKGSSRLHHPERLLSTRKAISPSSQDRLCKAMESIDIDHQNNLKCRGKLYFSEQTDKNGDAKGLNDTRAGFTDNSNKISVNPKTFKRGPHPKGTFKIPHSSRPVARIQCNSVQSCSKSAIAFSKQQMHDIECLAMKLTKELKSMKDIVDDMLRSEFCLNTSLRYKVNEARMAVKNATRAEEAAKRCLSFMARDCSRFCKIMKLADGGPSAAPQDVVSKEKKRIAFADEAGGRLCQVRFYEDDEVSLSESH